MGRDGQGQIRELFQESVKGESLALPSVVFGSSWGISPSPARNRRSLTLSVNPQSRPVPHMKVGGNQLNRYLAVASSMESRYSGMLPMVGGNGTPILVGVDKASIPAQTVSLNPPQTAIISLMSKT